MPNGAPKPPSHTHIPWLALVLFALAAFAFFLAPREDRGEYSVVDMITAPFMDGAFSTGSAEPIVPKGIAVYEQGSTESMMYGGGSAPALMRDSDYYYPQPQAGVPATDTREFLKTDYNAQIQTRDVQGITKRVETVVRGHAGRVDSVSSGPKFGSVGFVMPSSKFDDFRNEIESLVSGRFITIQIHSENLLSQKLNIEEQEEMVGKSLEELEVARKKLVSEHSATVRNLQNQITAGREEIEVLYGVATEDPVRIAQITGRIEELERQSATLAARLSQENQTYTYRLNSFDQQIAYMKNNLENVQEQDQDLLDTVATVRGTISLRWISLWEMAHLYVPGYWIPSFFVFLGVVAFFFQRRRDVGKFW